MPNVSSFVLALALLLGLLWFGYSNLDHLLGQIILWCLALLGTVSAIVLLVRARHFSRHRQSEKC
jgi:hypothetical protein